MRAQPTRPHIDPEQVLEHDPFVRGLARQLLRDADAADDVAQQTWIAACRQPVPPASLRAWLGTVARRIAARWQRGERRELQRQQAAAVPELVPSAATIAQREAVRASVPFELFDRGGALRLQSTAFSRGNDPPRLSTMLAPGTYRVVATTPTCRGEATIEVAETPVQATVALAPRR